jgi:Na+/melibiose symporter-like transporter
MTFSLVFTQHLPTLALVALGASETVVGVQSALGAADLLRLPTLRAVSVLSKRTILVAGQAAALVAAVPLLFFPALLERARDGGPAVAIALLSLIGVTAWVRISDTVWFPLLRSYVEPARIGRFFGTLRSGWHLALIFYYLGASAWLARDPSGFGPLFAAAWMCGLLRIALIRRLPERSERTGQRIRAREAIALLRDQPLLRRYLVGVSTAAAVRGSVVPFVIVMMRREVGFTDGQVLYTTVASFAGGLASLYLWGRAVDRVGAAPVFRLTSLGSAILIAALMLVETATPGVLAGVVAFFFLHAVLTAGFGVADTHVLFGLAPDDAPARTLVIAAVVTSLLASLAPLFVGLGLEVWLEGRETGRLVIYHAFFATAALVQAVAFWPLRGFRG